MSGFRNAGWLVALSLLIGCSSMQARLSREVGGMGLASRSDAPQVVTEADLAPLPKAAQRYLRYTGVVGRPRDWSFRMKWSGRFRTSPSAEWAPCEAWQYNNAHDVTRVFHMELAINALPVVVRDTYRQGKAQMLGKLFDLVPVVNESGEEIVVGELVTYLNDAVMLAPSMLLGPAVTWQAVDADTFDVALTDSGRTVKARVYLDAEGAPRDFSTTDRFVQDPYDPKHPFIRCEWHTPSVNWVAHEGRKFSTSGQAVWHLPQGKFAYGEVHLDPKDVVYNLRPGE